MIVISNALRLSPMAMASANRPVFAWENRVTAAGIEADTEDASHPATNLANPNTAARWQGEDTSDQHLTFTIGGDEPTDGIGLARHNLGSGVIALSIEGEDPEEPDSWTEIVEPFIPSDNSPILCRYVAGIYSRIRVKLQPTSTIPRIAVAYIGKLLVMTEGQEGGSTPIHLANDDEVFRGQSQSGDYLGSITTKRGLSTSISFRYLTYPWFLEHMKPFVDATRDRPFFYAWAPLTYPDQVGFAWTTANVRPVLNAPLFIDVSLNVSAVKL